MSPLIGQELAPKKVDQPHCGILNFTSPLSLSLFEKIYLFGAAMATIATTSRTLRLPLNGLVRSPWRTHCAAFSSSKVRKDDKVQTPLQSQSKDSVANTLRPAEGNTVQTLLQRQDPSRITPGSAHTISQQTIWDPWPFYTLVGGLLAGSVFVYFYYNQRKAHMEQKWQNMLKEAEEKAQGKG